MFACVGGYTSKDRDGRGNGIHVYRVDASSGAWTHVQHVADEENPSLFTLHPDRRVLYSVHGGRTHVSAFNIDRTSGHLRLLNRQDCGGNNPVDAAVDATGRFLIVPNYSSGNVVVLPLAEDGALQAVSQVFELPGSPGPHPEQQGSSHPHAVIFDPSRRFAIVPDKGFDCTFIFRFEDGRLELNQAMPSRPGAAPRHCVFHPTLPVLYVNNELDSTVTSYRWRDGRIEEIEVVATLPEGETGRNTTAEIGVAPDGRFLYVSNRGHDSVAVFAIAQDSGRLSFFGCEPTGGRRPRFFTLDPAGDFLYAANQEDDNIVAFSVDKPTGMLTRTVHEVRVGSPSAISFLP
jgi:6-phosphogluconolactonase (cycloisomerase 2 family)